MVVVVVVLVFFVKATPSSPKPPPPQKKLNPYLNRIIISWNKQPIFFLRERSDLVEHDDLTLFLTGSRSF